MRFFMNLARIKCYLVTPILRVDELIKNIFHNYFKGSQLFFGLFVVTQIFQMLLVISLVIAKWLKVERRIPSFIFNGFLWFTFFSVSTRFHLSFSLFFQNFKVFFRNLFLIFYKVFAWQISTWECILRFTRLSR